MAASRMVDGRPNGAAAAALIGAGVGVLALAVTQVATHVSAAAKDAVFALGKLWMPGAEGIGPYSGKETIALLAWLSAWGLGHLVWRQREVSLTVVGAISLALVGGATTLLWPPLWELLGSH